MAQNVDTLLQGCRVLDWIGLYRFFCFKPDWRVNLQTCIGLNRIDPGAALLYYVPDCTGLYWFLLCTGLYRLYYVPVCTGLYRMYRYNTGPLGPGARAPWPRGPGPLAQGPGYPGPVYITNRIYEPD